MNQKNIIVIVVVVVVVILLAILLMGRAQNDEPMEMPEIPDNVVPEQETSVLDSPGIMRDDLYSAIVNAHRLKS